jgi:copper chaperone NosL
MKKLLIAALIPLLSACFSEVTATDLRPEPLHDHDRCHLCGMMITKYPGPKGQVILNDGETRPRFCSSRDMFNYVLQPENGRRTLALFVHDMGATNWETPDDSAFIDAKSAFYVYGTSKKAVMGPAVAPFASREAAEKFAADFGGRVLGFDDISLELLKGED